MTNEDSEAVERMRAYYAQRAAVYERVYAKPERQADLRAMEAWLPSPFAGRSVLEVACGTAWWTPHGARDARRWLATDVNEEVLAIARAKKPMPAAVSFANVDAYTLAGLNEIQGSARFDAAFAGFWWSHVPLARLTPWLEVLHARLAPGARVVFCDNRNVEGSSTPLSRTDADGNTWQQRTLDDGSRHEVLKNYPGADEAIARLGPRAAEPQWIEHAHYWILSYLLK